MSAPHGMNLKKEFVWTAAALASLALGLFAVTWLAQRPAAFVSVVRKYGWVTWLVVAGGAAWRLVRRQRIAEENTASTRARKS